MKQQLLLDGIWSLFYCENPQAEEMETQLLAGNHPKEKLEAQVPGSFELDFVKAGLIEDPYFGDNILKMESYEYYHFFYLRCFDFVEVGEWELVLEGIDTFSTVWINGEKLCNTDNMFINYRCPVSLRQGENEILIHIRPAVIEARKQPATFLSTAMQYNYDSLSVRKSPHMFGWDIAPRLISAGIWRSVLLEKILPVHFRQQYLITRYLDKASAEMLFFYDLELAEEQICGFQLQLEGVCGNKIFNYECRIWGSSGKAYFTIFEPSLWWPKGHGNQNLYSVKAKIVSGNIVLDEVSFEIGIRTVRLFNSEIIDDEGKGDFTFEINGRRLFICGTNWVPADAIPARADKRVRETLELVDEIGCCALRVWGGGHYESDEFYSICDQKGILVWQDFMMACANYPQNDKFFQKIKEEAKQVIRRLRQHPSLVIWAGDNECDEMSVIDPGKNIITRRILPETLMQEDYTRPYLPSSPYYSPKMGNKGSNILTEQHLWGDRICFKSEFYAKTKALFASEIGYHGCPSPDSIWRFISPDKIWPWQNNRQWIAHATSPGGVNDFGYGTRNELMANQIKVLFGEIPDKFERFALASQISQAESLKFFIEQFRCRKGVASGIMWWNIRDCWPQFSDAVVDYYGYKKLAFSYIKRSQQMICLMICEEQENDPNRELIAVNENQSPCYIQYTISSGCDVLHEGKATLPPDSRVLLEKIVLPKQSSILLLEWNGDASGKNTYLNGTYPYNLDTYIREAKEYKILEIEGFTK